MRFVLTENLEPGMILARDIIIKNEMFMLSKSTALTENYIMRLKNAGYFGTYITDSFSKDVVYEQTITEKLFAKGVAAVESEDIGSMITVANQIVDDISAQDNIGLDMYDLRSYNEYTYHHSVNVAVYCAAVGKKLELSKEDLEQLCMAAMTHDLGKMQIPEDILNKPEKLTNEEYELIKSHPKFSYDILQKDPSIPIKVKQAVLFHHENENGTGYPMGKSGNDIPYFSKIIHAVDVYDALTSRRAYKDPYSSADVFEYLKGGCNILFDEKIIDVMLSVIPLYLPGTDVCLSNGEHALVVGHSTNPKRPIIKLYGTEELVNLDLNDKYEHEFIIKSGFDLESKSRKVTPWNENRGEKKAFKEKILIVDDSFLTLTTTKKILENDYIVDTLQSGMEAMTYFQNHSSPDLIIMDIQMPGMDGIETVKMLQKKDHISSVPIVFFTSTCSKEVVIQCKKIGACDYILKPAPPIYLKERIDLALKKYFEE